MPLPFPPNPPPNTNAQCRGGKGALLPPGPSPPACANRILIFHTMFGFKKLKMALLMSAIYTQNKEVCVYVCVWGGGVGVRGAVGLLQE